LTVLLDSIDTLAADLSSPSQTYTFLSTLLSDLLSRPSPSRLILHTNPSTSSTPTLALQLASTRFSPHIAHITAHPPALLAHVARAYLTPPPPLATPEKFWRVFAPIAARGTGAEAERAVFGPEGEGSSGGDELVCEVLVRGGESGRKGRGVERELEGWKGGKPCELRELEGLKDVFAKKILVEEVRRDVDPSFLRQLT
jgi:elongator complex protein 5